MDNINNILILGYGMSGKSAAKVTKDLSIEVYIYDDYLNKPEDITCEDYKFILDQADLDKYEFDLVMKSPGIHPDNPVVEKLSKEYEIISDIELAYLLNPDKKIIAVTGTNGKTTTTMLINKMLNDCGLTSISAGNIGLGAVEAIANKEENFVVLECSSYQLSNIKNFKAHIGVITNIEEDHLDYHGDLSSYQLAKLNLLKNFDKDDFLVLNKDDKTSLESIDPKKYRTTYVSCQEELEDGFYLKNGSIYFSNKTILKLSDLQLLGKHNYYNIMQTMAVGRNLKLDLNMVKESLKSFEGVEHRIEFVKEEDGVSYYNDSKSTNLASTRVALDAFDKNIILILGGFDKGEDFSSLIDSYKSKIKKIHTYGQNSCHIYQVSKELGFENIEKNKNLKESIEKIKKEVVSEDIVLFSPGSASLDMYKNFEERGQEFKSLI